MAKNSPPEFARKSFFRYPDKISKLAKILGGITIYFVGVYYAYNYFHPPTAIPTERRNRPGGSPYDDLAPFYDAKLSLDEWITGITKLRRKLISERARGEVLEIACGTGRNIDYYPMASLSRVVGIDSSDPMLHEARTRAQSRDANWRAMGKDVRKLQFINGALCSLRIAHSPGNAESIPFDDNSFDTVIDTFGLCSFQDPSLVLKEMQRVCKPDGTIILLEHGRSKKYNFLSNYLDRHSEQHLENWGCLWNKDIERFVLDSNLKIIEKGTKHFGTTYYFVGFPVKLSKSSE